MYPHIGDISVNERKKFEFFFQMGNNRNFTSLKLRIDILFTLEKYWELNFLNIFQSEIFSIEKYWKYYS